MPNPEKSHEAGREKQGANNKPDLEAEMQRLKQEVASLRATHDKELKDKETEKRKDDRKDDWKAMGGRAPDNRIKRLIEEIGKNPDYFNSEETLRDAALRLAKEISRASSGTSIGRDWRITSQQDKFDWDKLIGGSTILKKAFSQDTLDTAKALAEIDRRTSVYGEKSRMRQHAEEFAKLIRQAKNGPERDKHLKNFLKLHAALWEDNDAIAYLQGMADSIDDPAVKAAAKTAQAAIEHAPKMNDAYRRRLVLNFVDDVSKIRGAAAPAAPAAQGLPLAFFLPGRESLPRAEAEAGREVGSSETEKESAETGAEAPATKLEAGAAAPSVAAPSATPERAPRQPKMTDERRIQVMEKLGFPLDRVQAALNITSAKPSEIVAAIRKAQGDIWKTLKKDDAQNFRAAKEFADGIWGPETQKALQTIAVYDGVDQKWKNRLAAFSGGVRLESSGSLPLEAPKIAEARSLELAVIPSTQYPQDTVPTPESISLASDVRHIHIDDAVVVKKTEQVVRVLNIPSVNNQLKERPPLALWVETLDGEQFSISAASDEDDLSKEVRVATAEEKDKFVKDKHASALAQYKIKEERDRNAINEALQHASPDTFKNQKYYAKLKPDTITINFAGKESGVKVRGEIAGNHLVAVLNRSPNSKRIFVMTQTGKTGWIEAGNFIQNSLTEKGKDEDMKAVLARVDNLTKQNAPAAAVSPATPATPNVPRAEKAPRAAQGQVTDAEEPLS